MGEEQDQKVQEKQFTLQSSIHPSIQPNLTWVSADGLFTDEADGSPTMATSHKAEEEV